jgi:hypothetical protein
MEGKMTMPRPKMYDKLVTKNVALALLPKALKWADVCDEYAEQHLKDLEDALENAHSTFSIAKRLDDLTWNVDDALVDILEEHEELRYNLHKDAEREWVEREGIRPKYAVGDTVKFLYDPRCTKMVFRGEIVKVSGDTAQYHIFSAGMGHVRPGVNGTTAIVVDFENILEGDEEVLVIPSIGLGEE